MNLLDNLRRPGRHVMMFELPLPPFYHRYGEIQRRIARRFEVVLIPKRVLLSVITSGGATSDTIHLTQAGHDRLAEKVVNMFHASDAR